MIALIHWLATLSDTVILTVCATAIAGIALLLAAIAHWLLFAGRYQALEEHGKLAEVVHGSLLAFTVFVLALVLTDVRSNLARADDAVSREGSYLARLDRDLAALTGSEAEAARQALRAYAESVVRDEWHALSLQEAGLSAKAGQSLASLVTAVRGAALAHPDAGASLRGLLDKLEDHRQGRLETASKSVPSIFWWMIAVFLISAMLMNGRYRLTGTTLALIAVHMAAIGMVLGLIIIMDEPFRGETSISSAPLTLPLLAGR